MLNKQFMRISTSLLLAVVGLIPSLQWQSTCAIAQSVVVYEEFLYLSDDEEILRLKTANVDGPRELGEMLRRAGAVEPNSQASSSTKTSRDRKEWKDMSPWQKALSVVAGIVFVFLFIVICCVVLVVFCAGSVLFCILDCLTLGPCRRACGCYWFPWDKKADENIDDADAPVHHSNSNSLSDIVKMEQQVVQAAPPPPPPMDYQAQNFQNYGAPPPPHNYGAPPP
eukprot:Selendium_serpulae@DN4386_c0_g1_i1.p1